METELKRIVLLRVPYITDAEYQLGYLRTDEPRTENAIVSAIEAHREPSLMANA